jgi:CheY-like chemotaxis protein
VGSVTLGKDVAESLRQFRQNDVKYNDRGKFEREQMPYGTVLVVDDMEANLYVAVRFLKPYKLCIETAVNGREALEKVKAGMVFDIIFMDHMMPVMDGMEATRLIRETGYTQPIVALTANAVTGQAEVCLQNGFDAFISKPINILQLDAVLQKYVLAKHKPDVIISAYGQRDPVDAPNDNTLSSCDPQLIGALTRDTKRALNLLGEFNGLPGWHEDEKHMRRFILTVHGMKSTLKCIGETDLSDFASKMEMWGRGNDIKAIRLGMHGFMHGLRALLLRLESGYDGYIVEKETP